MSDRKRLRELDKEIRGDKGNADLRVERGDLYRAMGKYSSALRDYNDAIARNPDSGEAYFGFGLIYANEGRYTDAIRYYDKAMSINPMLHSPQYATAFDNRGASRALKGNYDLAFVDFDRAIAMNPEHARTYSNRASLYSVLGDHESAIRDATIASRLDQSYLSSLAAAHYNKGIANAKAECYDTAISHFEQANRIDPSYGTPLSAVYINRGVQYQKEGDHERALTDAMSAVRSKSDYAPAHNFRGVCYFNVGRYGEAVADSDSSIALSGRTAAEYINRALAYMGLDEFWGVQSLLGEGEDLFAETETGLSNGIFNATILNDLDTAARLYFDYYETDSHDGRLMSRDDGMALASFYLNSVVSESLDTEFDLYYAGVREIFANDLYIAEVYFKKARQFGDEYKTRIAQHLKNLGT